MLFRATDIKPANFVRRQCKIATSSDLHFCLLDFGIAKKLPSSSSRSSNISRSRDGRGGFRGTTMYASVAAHEHEAQGRRDDLWSLLFVFVDLVAGGLPWTAAARQWQAHKKKQPVQQQHQEEEEEEERSERDGEKEDDEEVPTKRQRVGQSPCAEVSVSARGNHKEEVFALKRTFTARTVATEQAEGTEKGGEEALLTQWVEKELVQHVLAAAGAGAEEEEEEEEGARQWLETLKHCLNTAIRHLQVRAKRSSLRFLILSSALLCLAAC